MTTTDIPHPRFARAYVRMAAKADRRGAEQHRRRLLDGLTGTVLELGAGHGANFPHYPAGVDEVAAVEPEPTLRAEAERAAAGAPVPVLFRTPRPLRLPRQVAARRFFRRAPPDEWREHEGCLEPAELPPLLYVTGPE